SAPRGDRGSEDGSDLRAHRTDQPAQAEDRSREFTEGEAVTCQWSSTSRLRVKASAFWTRETTKRPSSSARLRVPGPTPRTGTSTTSSTWSTRVDGSTGSLGLSLHRLCGGGSRSS